jgi:hypothetical protein
MKIVEPLLIAIEGLQSDFNDIGGMEIGFLPHHLHVDALAQRIAERCKTEPFDQDLSACPRVHNLSYGNEIANTAEDTDGDASRYAEPLNGHIQGYLVPTIAQVWRPNGLPGRRMPNTSYSRKPDPLQRMHPDQPRVTCDACGKTGHVSNTCNFLAMLVFLQLYLKNGIATKDPIADAEWRWVEHWKDRGGSPGTTPAKVYAAFIEQSGLTFKQIEDNIDWLC